MRCTSQLWTDSTFFPAVDVAGLTPEEHSESTSQDQEQSRRRTQNNNKMMSINDSSNINEKRHNIHTKRLKDQKQVSARVGWEVEGGGKIQ